MKQITPKKRFSDDPGNKQSSSLLNDITDDYQRYQPTTPKTPRTPTAYSDVLEPGTPGSALAHTISFYRKQRSAQKGDGCENKSFMSQTSDSVMKKPHSSLEFADESLEDRLKQIEEAIMIQQDQISQLSHALSFCRQNVMFHGGAEEVCGGCVFRGGVARGRLSLRNLSIFMRIYKSESPDRHIVILFTFVFFRLMHSVFF